MVLIAKAPPRQLLFLKPHDGLFHGGPQPIEMTWKSALTERHIPTKAELQTYVREHRNWGRWGDKSEAGMVNLITAEKRVASARLVTSGRTKSETGDSELHDRHGHGDVSGDDRIRERPMSSGPGPVARRDREAHSRQKPRQLGRTGPEDVRVRLW